MAVPLQLPIIFGLLIQSAFSSTLLDRFFKRSLNSNPCYGYNNGDLVENVLDCHYYWKCGANGSTILQKCPNGFAFINGACSRSLTPCSITPKACQDLEVNIFLPSLSNCQGLWICTENGAQSASCPSNTTFNPMTNFCSPNYPCGNDVCVGLDITGKASIDGDCSNYWQCSSSGPTLKSCGPGYNFNSAALECQPNGIFECPAYVPFKPNCTNIFPGSMISGEYCDQFYICTGGEPLQFVCENGLVFSPEKEYCVTSNNYTCQTPLNPCRNQDVGSRLPIEGNCVNYLLCLDSGPVRLTCPSGYEFSVSEEECVPEYEANCSILQTTVPTTPPGISTLTTKTTKATSTTKPSVTVTTITTPSFTTITNPTTEPNGTPPGPGSTLTTGVTPPNGGSSLLTTTGVPTTTGVSTTTYAPTTTVEPTTTGVSTTTFEPTTTDIPTITGSPTTTNAPTTTGAPTTTNEPTTAELLPTAPQQRTR
ncbi:hypothetical protein ACFFRR_010480 [Megaselia abdita]